MLSFNGFFRPLFLGASSTLSNRIKSGEVGLFGVVGDFGFLLATFFKLGISLISSSFWARKTGAFFFFGFSTAGWVTGEVNGDRFGEACGGDATGGEREVWIGFCTSIRLFKLFSD